MNFKRLFTTGSNPVYPTIEFSANIRFSLKTRIGFASEAHVDGHSAFNGGAAGSRPAGGTNKIYCVLRELKSITFNDF